MTLESVEGFRHFVFCSLGHRLASFLIVPKGKRPEGIVFTNADPRYAGKLDDPQGGDTTMLMQQVKEAMTVNQEMEDKSN